MPNHRKQYNKPALNLNEQIFLLQERGLQITCVEEAKKYLEFIGYYRLSFYFPPFFSTNQVFKQNTNFDDIIKVYIFDRELRRIVMSAVECVEISFRSVVSNTMSISHGSHWFMDPDRFDKKPKFTYSELLKKIKKDISHDNPRKQEHFIQKYYGEFNSPELPPSWAIFEKMSFGTVSIIFENLQIEHRKKMASYFDFDEKIVCSWIHAISSVRNICAHHSRLWNFKFTISPIQAKKYFTYLNPNNKFYAQMIVIHLLLKNTPSYSNWLGQISTLIKDSPFIPVIKMVFPENWEEKFPFSQNDIS